MAQRLYVPLLGFGRSFALLSSSVGASRAAVFVHGFGGSAHKTWREFGLREADADWAATTDLYFFSYDSLSAEITASAERLNLFLDAIYPDPTPAFQEALDGALTRSAPYSALTLIGHSLGGVLLRAAMLERVKRARECGETMLEIEGRLRLFAPALAGARLAGLLSLGMRVKGLGSAARALVTASSSFNELQPGSHLISMLCNQTESFADLYPNCRALRAQIVWAETDRVAISLGYRCDLTHSRPAGTRHTTVCKPTASYTAPLLFVEASG